MRSFLLLAALLVAVTALSANGLHRERYAKERALRSKKGHLGVVEPPYPWWTGVELATAGASPQIEFFGSFTCPDCRDHWTNIIKPILAKYGSKISLVHQPFALPYQSYSMDCTQAALSVYRLTNNSAAQFIAFTDKVFQGQDFFFNTFDLTQRQVWEQTFAKWAAPLGISQDALFAAMNGTTTSANDDAWYSARFARQRTLPGAPTFIINKWLPFDIDTYDWQFSDWEKWIDSALPFGGNQDL